MTNFESVANASASTINEALHSSHNKAKEILNLPEMTWEDFRKMKEYHQIGINFTCALEGRFSKEEILERKIAKLADFFAEANEAELNLILAGAIWILNLNR